MPEPKSLQSSFVTLTFDILTQKCISIFLSPSCFYVWNMKAVRWRLLKWSYQNQSFEQVQLWPWPFNNKMYRYHPLTILHQCMLHVWKLYIENYSSYRVRTNVLIMFSCDLDLWPFDSKMYRYLSITILHICMKYESCTLKITQVIVSEPKCCQSSIVTLTFDLLIPKYIGIFPAPSCIYVYNMKLYIETYLSYRVRT